MIVFYSMGMANALCYAVCIENWLNLFCFGLLLVIPNNTACNNIMGKSTICAPIKIAEEDLFLNFTFL